jgi:hypothetical protein
LRGTKISPLIDVGASAKRGKAMTPLSARWVLIALATIALLSPGSVGQALAGVPLSAAGLLALGGVVYAAVALPGLSWGGARWLTLGLAIVLGLKLIAWAAAPPLGLIASYWAHAAPGGTPERSTDYTWLANATRIDASLDLRGNDFAVHFFDEAARFNFGSDVQPGRDQLPFSVRWQGWLLAPSNGERRFVVQANGSSGVWLDDTAVRGNDASVYLSGGLHTLRVEYTRPEARVPLLRLTWQREPGGALESVDGTDVRWQPSAASAEVSSMLGHVADAGFAALLLAWITLGLISPRRSSVRAALGLLPLVFLVHGMLAHAPLAGRATILSGLDDWLIYESSARDILLSGPMMDGGQGHAPPFYGQPLYPYVLALAHRLTGESLFGPLALQYAALGSVLVGAAVLARRGFDTRLDGLVGLAFVWLLVQLEAEHFKVARQLFNENLYMPLVMASLIVVVGLARQPGGAAWWRLVLTGALLGLTAIARSQFLLFVPFGVLVLVLAWRRAPLARAAVSVVSLVAGVVLMIAPVTARNWLVSGQFVPITSSGGASLLEFHRPPPGLIDQAALQTDPVYEALHLDTQTRTVLAFVRADPGGYLATLLPLGAHSVGLQGRNDPGIYWPLLVTSLLYLLSFGLKSTRRLHVWPIHAFVATHLVVLMLFEADTYGYRLVMPMYAPMAAVAAQVPLVALGFLLGLTRRMASAAREAQRATRFAVLGWSILVAAALLAQAKSVVDTWPDRETSLHGLGGPAALAAHTADQVGADAIYVASIDGTPRHFGAGSLPGLRYPWFKWFDPSRSVPLPKPASIAVYVLSELTGRTVAGDLVACLGPADANAQQVLKGDRARQQCADALLANAAVGVSFDGVARIDALRAPDAVEAGQALDARLVWQPLVAHPDAQQVSLQLDDPAAGDGTLWGNGTLELYPAREWTPDESVLSRLPVATDGTAIPQPYRLTVGIGPTRPNAPPATALWQGTRTDRVPVSIVALTPGNSATGQALPADMKPLEGPPLSGGGLELIGTRPLPAEAAIGGPLRIGLLWRALRDGPDAVQLKVRLVRANGEVVQETVLPLLGGRLIPSALHEGNVVRDEQSLLVGGTVPSEVLALDADVLDGRGTSLADSAARLGSVKMTGRAHVVDSSPGAAVEATFGEAMQLLSDQLEPGRASAGGKVVVKLRWRSAAAMKQAYKVFVHVLDSSGEQVVAQRDAEPQDGKAPTPGWVMGEVVDDEYAITLPAGLPAGDYPVEIGVYDPRSGDRLKLANGDNRVILSTRLKIQ